METVFSTIVVSFVFLLMIGCTLAGFIGENRSPLD